MITYHAIGEDVLLRFLLLDGEGNGLTGQSPTVAIKRRADGKYWSGSAWQTGYAALAMTEEDSTNLPGSYAYDFDQATADTGSNEYLVRYRNPPGDGNGQLLDEEQHVFRAFSSSLVPARQAACSAADDGVTFRLSVWIEEGGQRVTGYTSIAVQVKDNAGNLVLDLGTQAAQSADGLFAFSMPIATVQRNLPYVLAVQALRDATTDAYNIGLVRV